MYEYPMGNSQQLNLDWLLTEWRAFQKQIEDMIAAQWSDQTLYNQYDLVIHNHVFYYCSVATATVGTFDYTEWTAITVAEIVGGNL